MFMRIKNKVKMKKINFLLIIILIINFWLNAFGIRWGLPDRWNVDQKVTESLRMISSGSIISSDYYHPPFYLYILSASFVPYLSFLKLSGFPLEAAASKASISWIKFSDSFPAFASNLFLIARLLSVVFGILTVYFVYRIAKRIFGQKAALFSALTIAVSMGFVATNHFEFSSSLVNFLAILVLFFLINSLYDCSPRKLLTASFLAGLAFSTKYNGISLLIPLFLAYYYLFKEKADKTIKIIFNPFLFKFIILYLLGLIVGWPYLFISLQHISTSFGFYKNMLVETSHNIPIWVNFLNYFIQLAVIFGIPLFVFVFSGILSSLRYISKNFDLAAKSLVVILSLIIPYFFANVFSGHHKYAYTKYLILIAAPLAILTGHAILGFLKIKPKAFGGFVISVLFVYTFIYAYSSDLVFAKEDTRYSSTRWIIKNIPKGANIEHIDQVDWLFSTKILNDYNIVFLGRKKQDYEAKSLYKISDSKKLSDSYRLINDYCKNLNLNGSTADYFIIFIPEVADFTGFHAATECDKYIRALLQGEAGFKLIKDFKPQNYRVESRLVNGLNYFKNPFFAVNPSCYTSPLILIFKNKDKNGS